MLGMIRTSRTLVQLLIVGTLAGATPAVLDREAHLAPTLVAPAHVDLGATRPGSAVEHEIWLVNASPDPVEVVEVKGNCGCLEAVDFAPATLGAGSAHPLRVRMEAPKLPGSAKTKEITVRTADGDAATVKFAIEASNPTRVVPLVATIDVGTVDADTAAEGAAWLINTSDAPARITGAKGNCGCITLEGFEPMQLEAGRAVRVDFSIKAPEESGTAKEKAIVFSVDDGEPVRVTIRVAAG